VATARNEKKPPRVRGTGHGQLTLVEHSLCPLDPSTSLNENLVHVARYHFTDKNRHQQTAEARVYCPLGLSAHDELFLWGLLSITLAQPQAGSDFYATPHYCLREPQTGKDWSENEVRLVVADYFDMLAAELLGNAYKKSEHRKSNDHRVVRR
jgi:hypothetical protein